MEGMVGPIVILAVLLVAAAIGFVLIKKAEREDKGGESYDCSASSGGNQREKCRFYSRKRGWRNGYRIGPDRSGRILIELIARDGRPYRVRRQTEVVKSGWLFSVNKPEAVRTEANLATAAYLNDLEDRLESLRLGAGYDAAGDAAM